MKKYISAFIFSFLLVYFNTYAENSDFSEHIKLLEDKCYNNDYLSCYYAGQVFEDKGFALLAINAYEKACKNDIFESCVNLGNVYIKDYNKSIQKKSISLYNKACDNNIARGCSALGDAYYNGKPVRKNYRKARKLFEKACNLQDGLGCFQLGNIYKNGYKVKKNKDTALEYLKKSCDLKYEKACSQYDKLK